jgi:hypothetical protein
MASTVRFPAREPKSSLTAKEGTEGLSGRLWPTGVLACLHGDGSLNLRRLSMVKLSLLKTPSV